MKAWGCLALRGHSNHHKRGDSRASGGGGVRFGFIPNNTGGASPSSMNGAGGGSRTLVSALGRLHNGRYTTPAYAGAEDETRTHDLRFTKAPLYQLSYFGMDRTSVPFRTLQTTPVGFWVVFLSSWYPPIPFSQRKHPTTPPGRIL